MTAGLEQNTKKNVTGGDARTAERREPATVVTTTNATRNETNETDEKLPTLVDELMALGVTSPPLRLGDSMSEADQLRADRLLAFLGVQGPRRPLASGSPPVNGNPSASSDRPASGNVPRSTPRSAPRPARPDPFAAARRRLPALKAASGPPLYVEGTVGGNMVISSGDPRLASVNMGFPVLVHPLRIPNARALVANGVSVIDYKFLRISGLIHKMIPLRGIDDVHLFTMDDQKIKDVYGRVTVTFDAQGYEFEHEFWVIDLALPVDMQLGQSDFCPKFGCVIGFQEGGMAINKANAKKTRGIEDVYVVQ